MVDWTNVLCDKVIHERKRLLILVELSSSEKEEACFATLRQDLQMTAGNLSCQLKVLSNAGYVCITKAFKARKPQTAITLAKAGRQALLVYCGDLQSLANCIGGVLRQK